jgi:hypothetical protein
MREWNFDDAEDFRGQVHSPLLAVNAAALFVSDQNPQKAEGFVKDAHDVIHQMERNGYIEAKSS